MRKMKLGLASIAIAAFTLCTGVSLVETRAQEPLVIGIAKSSTGFMSPYDMAAALGIKLAIQDINAQGGLLGREIQWIYRDTKTDKAQSVIAAQELIDDGGLGESHGIIRS